MFVSRSRRPFSVASSASQVAIACSSWRLVCGLGSWSAGVARGLRAPPNPRCTRPPTNKVDFAGFSLCCTGSAAWVLLSSAWAAGELRRSTESGLLVKMGGPSGPPFFLDLSVSKIAPRGLPNPRFRPGSSDPGRAKLDLLSLGREETISHVYRRVSLPQPGGGHHCWRA